MIIIHQTSSSSYDHQTSNIIIIIWSSDIKYHHDLIIRHQISSSRSDHQTSNIIIMIWSSDIKYHHHDLIIRHQISSWSDHQTSNIIIIMIWSSDTNEVRQFPSLLPDGRDCWRVRGVVMMYFLWSCYCGRYPHNNMYNNWWSVLIGLCDWVCY